jgi:hypothetical protein
VLREVERAAERFGSVAAFRDRGEVEYRKWDHRRMIRRSIFLRAQLNESDSAVPQRARLSRQGGLYTRHTRFPSVVAAFWAFFLLP